DDKEVKGVLEYVQTVAEHPFIYPMFVFAAHTGARRSEICRSLIDDFDFDAGVVTIRERKRRKDLAATTRQVPLNDKLREVMNEWFAVHPGGQYTITLPLLMPMRRTARKESGQMSRYEASHHFKQTLVDSKWDKVRGFHVLRHSFGAICTRAQIPMNVIAAWMGHSTEEMKEHYQHILPQDQQDWMKKLPL
ncbi:MAG TPA: tyrosine-type recombinase/integrase, partial [Pirellulaceae bacterium]|nr:tyrosine-type recombinase/integrase [Pirellulaceae bacterium]